MRDVTGQPLFRLQIVDAESNVVMRFAGGGRVECDLIAACTDELTRIPPNAKAALIDGYVNALRRVWFGLFTRRSIRHDLDAVVTIQPFTPQQISDAIEQAILSLKSRTVQLLRDEDAARRR